MNGDPHMARWTLGLIAAGLVSGAAFAQVPPAGIPGAFNGYSGPTFPYGSNAAGVRNGPVAPALNYVPGFGVGVTPPLSPYLNLLRGGNPAVNYFYGVRPWQAANAYQQSAAQAAPSLAYSQVRSGYIPAAGNPSDQPVEVPPAGQPVTLSPSGHPVVFGNRFGTMIGGYPGTASANRPGNFSSQPPPAFNRNNPTGGAGGTGAGSRIPPSR